MIGETVTYRAYTCNGMAFREGRITKDLGAGEFLITRPNGWLNIIHASAILDEVEAQ